MHCTKYLKEHHTGIRSLEECLRHLSEYADISYHQRLLNHNTTYTISSYKHFRPAVL